MTNCGACCRACSGLVHSAVRARSRIGLFGGTFDPPHVGHLVTAVNVRHALCARRRRADGGQRALAEGRQPADHAGADRLAMVRGRRGRRDRARGRPRRDRPRRAELHRRHPGDLGTGAPRRRRSSPSSATTPPPGSRPGSATRRSPSGRSWWWSTARATPVAAARRASAGSGSRCPTSRCRAPICGPVPPTAGRSTTWSPTRCSTSSRRSRAVPGGRVSSLAFGAPPPHRCRCWPSNLVVLLARRRPGLRRRPGPAAATRAPRTRSVDTVKVPGHAGGACWRRSTPFDQLTGVTVFVAQGERAGRAAASCRCRSSSDTAGGIDGQRDPAHRGLRHRRRRGAGARRREHPVGHHRPAVRGRARPAGGGAAAGRAHRGRPADEVTTDAERRRPTRLYPAGQVDAVGQAGGQRAQRPRRGPDRGRAPARSSKRCGTAWSRPRRRCHQRAGRRASPRRSTQFLAQLYAGPAQARGLPANRIAGRPGARRQGRRGARPARGRDGVRHHRSQQHVGAEPRA